ncbi:MAG TPA: YncE family protein, partial [Rhodanobacteraceae bacterium]|nr:YncE family protein [Rhodanobacteraceae bacterium]
INAIDASSRRVIATWKLDGCESPSGLALDAARHRLFSVCSNEHMVVTDSESGKHIATVPIGKGPDGAAYDPDQRLVYSPNGRDGTLSIIRQIDADHYEVAATVPTQPSARTMALDVKSHTLYLSAATLGPPPAPTKEQPRPRPSMVADSFCVLVVSPGDVAHHKS